MNPYPLNFPCASVTRLTLFIGPYTSNSLGASPRSLRNSVWQRIESYRGLLTHWGQSVGPICLTYAQSLSYFVHFSLSLSCLVSPALSLWNFCKRRMKICFQRNLHIWRPPRTYTLACPLVVCPWVGDKGLVHALGIARGDLVEDRSSRDYDNYLDITGVKYTVTHLGDEEEYITNNSYIAQSTDELSFEKGVVVLVTQKNYDGWWLCRYRKKEGLMPAAYLETNTQEFGRAGQRRKLSTLPMSRGCYLDSPERFLKSQTNHKSIDTGQVEPKLPTIPITAATDNQFIPRRQSIKQVSIRKRKERETLGARDKRIPEHKIDEFIATGDYETQDSDGLSFREGDVIEIVEKHDTGWWWANLRGELGWVPSTYLEKKEVQKYAKEPSPKMTAHRSSLLAMKPKQCTSNGPFISATKDILPFKTGESFNIIQKTETGWWYLKNAKGQEGWAPDYLLVEGENIKPSRPAPASPTKPSQINSRFPVKDITEPAKPFLPVNKTFNGDFKAQLKPVTPSKPGLVDKPVIQNKLPTKPTVIGKPDKPVIPIQPKHTETSQNFKPIKMGSVDKPVMPNKPSSYTKLKIDPSGVSGGETNKPLPSKKPRPTIHESQCVGNELSDMITKRLESAPNKPIKPSRPVSQDISGFEPVSPNHKKQSDPIKPIQTSRPSRPSRPTVPTIATQECTNYVTIDDNRAYDEGCLSFRKGETAELIEKGTDGWLWMRIRRDEGWVLEDKIKLQSNKPSINSSSKKAGPVALEDFRAEHEGSISIKMGDSLQVIEKDSGSGWTWVRAGKEEGWVPTDIIRC
ncbi:hypothetical protein LOD99_13953 [Oopsacas minuta]|uniref:SH3 domain-containing protein n=1 Tax=Oopsacas minuta TaxID=111878 RepID=A0AAV7KGD2_9METZ|nr:hypothetical protein LOD99_13953 [Oopsacas minuta]